MKLKKVFLGILTLALLFILSIPVLALTYGYVTPGPDTWYKKDVEGFSYGAEMAPERILMRVDFPAPFSPTRQ
jgi:ribose transport system substrate-binding protein